MQLALNIIAQGDRKYCIYGEDQGLGNETVRRVSPV